MLKEKYYCKKFERINSCHRPAILVNSSIATLSTDPLISFYLYCLCKSLWYYCVMVIMKYYKQMHHLPAALNEITISQHLWWINGFPIGCLNASNFLTTGFNFGSNSGCQTLSIEAKCTFVNWTCKWAKSFTEKCHQQQICSSSSESTNEWINVQVEEQGK